MDSRGGLRADSARETPAGRFVPQQGPESQGYAGCGKRESGGFYELDVDRRADCAEGRGGSRGILEGPAHPVSGRENAIAVDEHVLDYSPEVTSGAVAVGSASLSAPLLRPEYVLAASTLARTSDSDSAAIVSGDSSAPATRSAIEAAVRYPRDTDEGQAAIAAEECPGMGVPARLDGAKVLVRCPPALRARGSICLPRKLV